MFDQGKRWVVAALSSVLAGACNAVPFESPAPTTVTRTTIQPLADAESVRVISSINMGEVSVAQSLLVRSQKDPVRAFAGQMITEHSQLELSQRDVANQQGISPVSTDANRAIDADASMLGAQIATAPLALVDATYLNSEVAVHQQALSLIDCSILPGAQNQAYKTFVESTVRPMIQAHLDLAQSLASVAASPTASLEAPNVTLVALSPATCSEVCIPGTVGALSQGLRDALCR